MNDRYTDKELTEKFGKRQTGVTPLDSPAELGYRCPKGHSDTTWSEFKDHIWCYKCQKDYHYAEDCFLINDNMNPASLPQNPKVITSMKNWDKTGNFLPDVPKHLLPKQENL